MDETFAEKIIETVLRHLRNHFANPEQNNIYRSLFEHQIGKKSGVFDDIKKYYDTIWRPADLEQDILEAFSPEMDAYGYGYVEDYTFSLAKVKIVDQNAVVLPSYIPEDHKTASRYFCGLFAMFNRDILVEVSAYCCE